MQFRPPPSVTGCVPVTYALRRRSAKKSDETCRKSLWFRVPNAILNSVEGILNVAETRKTKNKAAMNTVTNSSASSVAVVAAKLTKSAVPAGRTVVAAKPAVKPTAPVKAVPAAKPAAPGKAVPAAKPAKKATVKPAAPSKAKPVKTDTKTKPDAKPVKKNATKGSVGRPKKVIKLIMNKTFSLRDVVSLNPTTNKLTVRKHILDGVKSGVFMKLTETISTGKRGKPAHLFVSAKPQTVADALAAAGTAGAVVA